MTPTLDGRHASSNVSVLGYLATERCYRHHKSTGHQTYEVGVVGEFRSAKPLSKLQTLTLIQAMLASYSCSKRV